MEIPKTVLEHIQEQITPTKKDRELIEETRIQFTALVEKEIEKISIPIKIELVGSIAKDTYLRNTLDFDVFLLFSPTIDKEAIASTTLTIGRKILQNTEECYAEHPYIRGNFNSFKIELVPGYQIKDARQKLSAVDRTPLHTHYIKKHITDQQKHEIRLFKQFLHGIHCYGAEAEIQGFSGYLCEILILYYQTFSNLIQNAQKWKPQIQISLEGQSIPSFPEPLVFIDPVDPERNVASAVSSETLQTFIDACNAFSSHPSHTFFFPNPVKPWQLEKIEEKIQKEKTIYLGIQFKKPNLIPENLIPQIRKTCKSIQVEAIRYGFTIHDIQFHIDNVNDLIYIIIKTDKEPLSETYTHVGPPIDLEEHGKKFLSKWKDHPLLSKDPYEKKKRLYVDVKRKHRDLPSFLLDNISKFRKGKHVEKQFTQYFNIIDQKALLKEELRIFWTTYLDNKKPWER